MKPSPLFRTVSALRIDGGTRLMRAWNPDAAPDHLCDFLRMCRRVRTAGESDLEKQVGGRYADLPVLPSHGVGTPRALVACVGERRHVVSALIADVVHILIDVEAGTVRVEGKARALWADGYRAFAQRWLAVADFLVGETPGTIADARERGWRVTGLELCSDFVGLDLAGASPNAWVTPPRSTRGVHAHVRGRGAKIETVELGSRASPVSWCCYDKAQQIAAEKAGDASCYAAAWREAGWRGEPVTRAELRLSRRGLAYVAEDTGECIDLRDPAALADRRMLALAWRLQSERYRLVVPAVDERPARCEIDPRWLQVQAAANMPAPPLVQDRSAQRETWVEAADRAAQRAVRALARLGGLHALRPTSGDGLASLARLALARTVSKGGSVVELGELATETARTRATYLGREIWDTLGPVELDRSRVPLRGLDPVPAPELPDDSDERVRVL